MPQAPINPTAYAEAVAAAGGYNVEPISGADIKPDMELRHNEQWLAVQFKSSAGDAIRLDFHVDEPGATAFTFTSAAGEFYRRFPTTTDSSARV